MGTEVAPGRTNVSAVIVTRGDCDLTPILESLPYDDVIVWDNSRSEDLGIFGRYAAIWQAVHPVIYTQDDDVIVSCHEQLADAYRPGVLTVNYYPPVDIPWLARGALFDRDLYAQAFARYLDAYPCDRFFTHYACDGIFALLSDTRVIDEGAEDLPHGLGPGRVSTTGGWYEERRPLIQQRCSDLAEAA